MKTARTDKADKKQTIYVTKYALSRGIFRCTIDHITESGWFYVFWEGGLNGRAVFPPKECHASLDLAVAHVHKRIEAKRTSIKKELKKLDALFAHAGATVKDHA